MRNPEELLERPSEHALIDPGNIYVLSQHLSCAALELSLTPRDEQVFGPGFIEAMIELEEKEILVYEPDADSWIYMGPNYPAQGVNIRSMGRRPIKLVEAKDEGRQLEAMDASIAPARVHPGAIYIHGGESYQVKSLDLEAGVAKLLPVEVDYYTQTREISDIKIVQSLRAQPYKRVVAHWGSARVTQQVVAYRKIRHFTEHKSKEIELDMPSNAFLTRALWWDVPKPWQKAVARRGWNFSAGLRAIGYALMEMLPSLPCVTEMI